MKPHLYILLVALVLLGFSITAPAQTTAFTYQGRLLDNGAPANGTYDLTFSLFDSSLGGTQVGSTLTKPGIAVGNGQFTVTLDFGPGVFNGADRWLAIGVRTAGGSTFVSLTPLQALTPTPYAIMANAASNLSGTLPAAQLSGVLPSDLLAGTYSASVNFTNLGNQFSGNGAGLSAVNAATLGGFRAAGFWQTTGNAGANPTNGLFVGTTDFLPLDLRVNGASALRLEPATNSPNIIAGSASNLVVAGVFGGTISGGGSSSEPNTLSAAYAVIGGGLHNATASPGSIIGGGRYNFIDVDATNATIAGGVTNSIAAGAFESFLGGGNGNSIGSGASDATIGGGNGNLIDTGASDATIAGGDFNSASAPASSIGGGEFNIADGYASTVPGGAGNSATGDYSFAAGSSAIATNVGAFVWADSAQFPFSSSADNQFSARATGGVRFVSAVSPTGTPTAGVSLSAGGGSWSSLSDRNAKDNLESVNPREVLSRLLAVPIATWNYKAQPSSVRHIGPMAQDFSAAFEVGEDARHITSVDADGVALAAIQGLNQKLEESNAQLQQQLAVRDAEIQLLKTNLAQLKDTLDHLERSRSK